jgi:NAD(P)-dependent dehydrogenase (short-subunit alcohol dehydrogenase family)
MRTLGGHTILIKTDVTDWEAVQAVVEKTLHTFGKIDVLVSNAGYSSQEQPFLEQQREV